MNWGTEMEWGIVFMGFCTIGMVILSTLVMILFNIPKWIKMLKK